MMNDDDDDNNNEKDKELENCSKFQKNNVMINLQDMIELLK